MVAVVDKIMRPTFRRSSNPGGPTRMECWGATSADGVWGFEREESSGTPWLLVHVPTNELVATFGSLAKARTAVERCADLYTASAISQAAERAAKAVR